MKLSKRRTRAGWVIGSIAFAIILMVCGVFIYSTIKPQKIAAPASQATTTPIVATPVSISTNTLFFGDVFWGRYINDWSMASPLKTAYPFSRLSEFNRDSYDAWIANLECPVVAGFSQTSAQEDATLSFNCSPDYLPEAAKWLTIASLANNHTDNRGVAGFAETRQHLEQNSMQYFGHYDPEVLDDACEVVALPVTVAYNDKTTKHQKIPVAMCGYVGVFKIPSAASIAQIQKYANLMPVIVMPHMGAEYKATPDSLREATYRAMIDAGADMVLGNHPHWIQPSESYKGKLIVYSMGNFIFDQQANKEVTRSAAIRVVMSTTDATSDQLTKWLALGESCTSFKDSCLEQAHSQNLEKLPIEYKYGVVGTNSANKVTKPASEAEQAQILERLSWSETMNQLRSPQGSL
ncbi:MAG: CapA family protein [Candidatus Saccharimonadaceae bacterium]